MMGSKPRISLIINTAALDPRAIANTAWYRSGTYGERAKLLREKILPAAIKEGFDEIIVCGVFEEGEGYRYVPMQPRTRDRRDALHQRDLGAAYSTGDILVFSHDDHAVGEGFCRALRKRSTDLGWGLLVPKRIHGVTGEVLNNGKSDDYMGGHTLVMRRWLWAEVPWTSVDTEWWDVTMTRLWRDQGGVIRWVDDLTHLDMEATANET